MSDKVYVGGVRPLDFGARGRDGAKLVVSLRAGSDGILEHRLDVGWGILDVIRN